MITDEIINSFLNNIDWVYLIKINILSYIVIKAIDDINPDKPLPSLVKTIITLLSAIIIQIVDPIESDNIYSTAILSLVSWDYCFKHIAKKLNIGYNHSKS